MKVRIEKKEEDKQGRQALRLVYDFGRRGNNPQYRKRENMGLFVYRNPKTPAQRQHNKENLRLAEAIKSKRIVEVQSGKFGLSDATKVKASFYDWFQKMTDSKAHGSKSNHSIWISTFKHLKTYHDEPELTFEQITPEFLEGFREYLLTQPLTKSKTKLSSNSASSYFNKVRAALNEAYKKGIIRDNPVQTIKSIKPTQNKREYLTLEELKALALADCRYEVLKRAFLFGCMTGLRWSDINKLVWREVQDFDGGKRIVFNQQKTGSLQYLDLNERAVVLMGEVGELDDRVFIGLKYSAYHNVALARWVMAAGINKHITFHSARHTFAVLQLTMGTDIYTVSKLLGHSEIKTTQIYADIIEQKRKEAMTQLPDIFGD